MDDVVKKPAPLTVNLSEGELMTLSNALNEVCHGPDAIEDWEFHSRIGATKAETQQLLSRIGDILARGRDRS